MSDDHRVAGRRASDWLKWWPIVVLVGGALISYGELRYTVASHAKQIERQWQIIGELRRE